MPVFLRNLIFLVLVLGALRAAMGLPKALHEAGVVLPQGWESAVL